MAKVPWRVTAGVELHENVLERRVVRRQLQDELKTHKNGDKYLSLAIATYILSSLPRVSQTTALTVPRMRCSAVTVSMDSAGEVLKACAPPTSAQGRSFDIRGCRMVPLQSDGLLM